MLVVNFLLILLLDVLTGRYFSICLLQQHDINKGWMPKPTQIIDCVEVEISPDN